MPMRGIVPDLISFNTLVNARVKSGGLTPNLAVELLDMVRNSGLRPDAITYNTLLSAYAGLLQKTESLFAELELKGYFPDAVTYNSLLYAVARERNTEEVKEVYQAMQKMGFGKDEMTYNTIIHMYGKQGQLDLALKLYKDMKGTVEAAALMSEMLDVGIKPTLQTYSALICGYAKAGKREEAQDTFSFMLR
ncbi:hypothetical protein F2Q70_00023146 [Brassica cretica]|uniref:Pentacotripeptide-repeat region of PRORP domain-containing protein n=1 Tax=Brassica cretica TaxID=69181 RepID=A0A8S9GKU9_BRACR|nr:hypothetical protein F2Q70_00023146 [Brassica cretica]